MGLLTFNSNLSKIEILIQIGKEILKKCSGQIEGVEFLYYRTLFHWIIYLNCNR